MDKAGFTPKAKVNCQNQMLGIACAGNWATVYSCAHTSAYCIHSIHKFISDSVARKCIAHQWKQHISHSALVLQFACMYNLHHMAYFSHPNSSVIQTVQLSEHFSYPVIWTFQSSEHFSHLNISVIWTFQWSEYPFVPMRRQNNVLFLPRTAICMHKVCMYVNQ